jgi:predicted nuclease with RNAse H fold
MGMPTPAPRVIGIDLAASPARRTGWALLDDDREESAPVRTTEEIVARTLARKPHLVTIDAPLSLPLGRDCARDDCACQRLGITRLAERELRRRGIGVFWCLLPSMQALTLRGMALAATLRAQNIPVLEVYPGAAQDLLGIARKRAGLDQLHAGLAGFGVRGIPDLPAISHDELDAITAALVGMFYLAGQYEAVGSEAEGVTVLPRC